MCGVLGATSGGTLLTGGCGRTPQRRAEFEAGSFATQLAFRQSVVPHLRRPHPLPPGSTRLAKYAGRVRRRRPWRRRAWWGNKVGDSSFEAAQRFACRLASGAFASVVGAAFGVAADLGDRDRVKGAVELPVPARVVAVSDGASGGRGQGAVPFAAAKALVGVAAGVDDFGEEPGGDQRADAVEVVKVVSAAVTSSVIWR